MLASGAVAGVLDSPEHGQSHRRPAGPTTLAIINEKRATLQIESEPFW
jgi:hypothetical protein